MSDVAISSLKIREMSYKDLDWVLSLEHVCYPTPWSAELFRQAIRQPEYYAYVGEVGGFPIGYCVFWKGIQEAHLMNLAVWPPHRGKGFGRAMLQFFMNIYPKTEIHRLLLEVRVSNHAAIELYRSAGFTDLAERKAYYADGEDALVMVFNR